jgi:DNA-binding NarL/FixJ family response regulator
MVRTMQTSPRQIPTLVVDDSPAVLKAICAFLQESPNLRVVATARDGREALALAKSLRPELVLLDVQMPEMNGIEAASHLETHCPASCVIMVTAYDTPELRQACLKCGVRGYICKNDLRQELLPLLRQIFGPFEA